MWSCDIAMAPQGALDRLSSAINRRGRRALGVLKTANEYVGVVGAGEFEIWERQKRAVHAKGHAAAVARGTHLEVEFVTPVRTRVFMTMFFVLYGIVAIGIATQPPEPVVSSGEILISAVGALVLAGLFSAGVRSQRADLRGFLERTFADVRRV